MSFGAEQVYCVFDYETYSEADLVKVGAYEYSRHPSTDILCAAWAIGTREQLRTAPRIQSWVPGQSLLPMLNAFDSKHIFVAHNAFFEQVITRHVLARKCHTQMYLKNMPPSRWLCTMSLAAALTIPMSLEGAGDVLKLPMQKSKEGKRLLRLLSMPQKPKRTKKNPNPESFRCQDAEELKKLLDYCVADIRAEIELFLACPPLSAAERAVWVLDQEINWRGFGVDRRLVDNILTMVDAEVQRVDQLTDELTFGAVSSARENKRLAQWLQAQDAPLPNLQKKTIEDALLDLAAASSRLSPDVRTMLEYRRIVSKSSTAKFAVFEAYSRSDGRLHDSFQYHGAATGRWAGRAVQPHNLPSRGLLVKDTDRAAEVILEGDVEWVRMLYGDLMGTFSSCVRSAIIPSDDHVFDVGDYSGIEPRVLFWCANHTDGLRAFVEQRDLYREQAAVVYGKPLAAVTGAERPLGKQIILGCGYQMGWKTFQARCKAEGILISEELAKKAVKAYRSKHWPVPMLWRDVQLAATNALLSPGQTYKAGRCFWKKIGDHLICRLPSGRRLTYFGASVRYEYPPFRQDEPEKVPVIYHWGVVQRKFWRENKTYGGMLVENIVQAIARDLLADALVRIDATEPWKVVMHVHDEIVAERPNGSAASVSDFKRLMETLPSWADGIPAVVEVWTGRRYRK